MKNMQSSQSGLSLSGLLAGLVLFIFAAIGGMKLIPAYMQNAEINNIFNAITHDPEMQGAPARAILDSFGKRAMMNNINVINTSDIEIAKGASGLELNAHYSVKIPLVGNASLLLEFNPSSASK